MHHSTDKIAFVTEFVENWLKREIAPPLITEGTVICRTCLTVCVKISIFGLSLYIIGVSIIEQNLLLQGGILMTIFVL